MAEFKDVPKSQTTTNKVLAYSVAIPKGVTQTYTIEFRYSNDEDVDQGDDMGKVLKGTLFITEGTEDIHGGFEDGTLAWQLLDDHSTRLIRTDFSDTLSITNTKTLYTATEEGTPVYYFAGNATDNWVKFGKNASNQDLYWRIIRTNSDGGVRLLYHGTSTTATDAYIGTSKFNETYNDSMYVGYMYGTSGSQESNRTNENSSTIKTAIDNWYAQNMTSYTKYLSTTAVYCNDREVGSGTYSATGSSFKYVAYTRLNTIEMPTYDCTNKNDKFTVDNTTGNGKLTYPMALMTLDEVNYAGVMFGGYSGAWYVYNSVKSSPTGSEYWWLLSPYYWGGGNATGVFAGGSNGTLVEDSVRYAFGVRPVTSLKLCIKYASGDGTSESPYTIEETSTGC